MVRQSGCIFLKLVDGLLCCKLLAESTEMQWTYITHHSDDVYSGRSEIERSQGF